MTVLFALPAALRSDDPVSSSVTFNGEVIRIFQRKCLPCHAPGAIAMSLATYRQARPWARAIREELIEQRMPPWPAAPGYGAFSNDIGLTARELTTILTWADGGRPRGEDRDLPPPDPGAPAPDRTPGAVRRLDLPLQQIPAGEEYVVRRVTIDPGFTEEKAIARITFEPGNSRVIRAAFISAATGDGRPLARGIGAWTPWLASVEPPGNAAFLLPAGARLIVDVHYRGREADLDDRSAVRLSFPAGETTIARQLAIETSTAPPTTRHQRRRGVATLREDARVWALLPDTAAPPARTASLEVSARRPDGTTDVLLWIPEGRYDWPTPYVLKTPVPLPAGTEIAVTTAAPRGSEPPTASTVVVSTLPRANGGSVRRRP
jgi:hypothetical protein